VRLRFPALYSKKTLEEIGGMLAAYPGVETIESNARTGSLLVHYDPAAISRERLDTAVAMLESRYPVSSSRPGRGRTMIGGLALRKIENRLLPGGALITLAGTVRGVRSVHAVGGAFFLLLALRHLYVRRRAF
jgi:hypothetical protein